MTADRRGHDYHDYKPLELLYFLGSKKEQGLGRFGQVWIGLRRFAQIWIGLARCGQVWAGLGRLGRFEQVCAAFADFDRFGQV